MLSITFLGLLAGKERRRSSCDGDGEYHRAPVFFLSNPYSTMSLFGSEYSLLTAQFMHGGFRRVCGRACLTLVRG